jgi:PAS domain-containing protein
MNPLTHGLNTMPRRKSTLNTSTGVAVNPFAGEEVSLLRALLQSTEEGVLMTTHEGQDVVCNRRFGELFGLDITETVRSSRDEVRRRVLERVAHPEQFVALLEKIYSDPDLVWEDEIEMIVPQPMTLRRRTRPVYNERGENIGRLWTFHDVTRVKRQRRVSPTTFATSSRHSTCS